jgi:hypothetical protein
MSKKKQTNKECTIALFDDEPVIEVKSASTIKKKGSKTSKDSSIDIKLDNKKNTSNEPNNDNNTKHSNVSITDTNKLVSNNNKKRISKRNGQDESSLENTAQRAKYVKPNISDDTTTISSIKGKNSSTRKSDKNISPNKQKSSRRECTETIASVKKDKRITENFVEQTNAGNIKNEKSTKGVQRLKQRYVEIDYVPGPVALSEKPIPINDDPTLVRVIINGEKRDVSSWSIKNNVYYPGLDSEFLVHCLKYKSMSSDNFDRDMLDSFNLRTNSNYKNWKEASHYKNLTENLLMEYGDKMDWSILLAEHNMDKFSDKIKKKFKSKYSFRCTII